MDTDTRQTGAKKDFFSSKEYTARLSILVISLLIAGKAVTSIVTGSIGIRADAIHNIIDLFGAVIGYIGIRIAGLPMNGMPLATER